MTDKPTRPWRERYRIHPVCDLFPMMDLESKEFADFRADIQENGIRVPVEIWVDADDTKWLMGGRHRLEAADQLGLKLVPEERVYCSDPYSWAISLNAARRHMTKEELADYVVAVLTAKAAATFIRQDGESIEGKRKRGGQVDEIKAAAVEIAKQHGISERTVERSLAKAEGRPKRKRKPKPKPLPDFIDSLPDGPMQLETACGMPLPNLTITGEGIKNAFRNGRASFAPGDESESERITINAGIEAARARYVAEFAKLPASRHEAEISLLTNALREASTNAA